MLTVKMFETEELGKKSFLLIAYPIDSKTFTKFTPTAEQNIQLLLYNGK